jgi:hypothetical protein
VAPGRPTVGELPLTVDADVGDPIFSAGPASAEPGSAAPRTGRPAAGDVAGASAAVAAGGRGRAQGSRSPRSIASGNQGSTMPPNMNGSPREPGGGKSPPGSRSLRSILRVAPAADPGSTKPPNAKGNRQPEASAGSKAEKGHDRSAKPVGMRHVVEQWSTSSGPPQRASSYDVPRTVRFSRTLQKYEFGDTERSSDDAWQL